MIKRIDLSQTYTHLQAAQLARKLNEVIGTMNAREGEEVPEFSQQVCDKHPEGMVCGECSVK